MKYTQTDKVFVDSNLWIYMSISDSDLTKYKKAIHFFETIINKNINTSIQVINEFHWVLFRKYKLSEAEISEKVDNGILAMSKVSSLQIENYKKAKFIREKYQISFWDSLIVSSALLNNCSVLYSEDMHNNLIIEDKLKIINPLF